METKKKETKKEVNNKEIIEAAKNPSNKLLMVIINRGFAEQAITHSRTAGATGATILTARGSAGVGEHFLGMNITPEKEIVLIVVKQEIAQNVMNAIMESVGNNTAASGICFCLPVDYITKLKH